MKRHSVSPDQLPLRLVDNTDAELERIIEARVAERAEVQAIQWRFRLVIIESVMMATLVLAAGIALDLPMSKTLTGAATVGIGCFLTGLMLIGLTGAASRLLAKLRRKS
ncbi:hypothetical protein PX699_24460 [Sphingobium sp. H39-3-25]|uniref:hypothetical protein n=1 Tax=Sphingobium TaxID=165695 RepID=UPI0023BA1BCD|nr:hypothetical protein [Sphingobium arseniciresistens]